jgi:hypothetical protein
MFASLVIPIDFEFHTVQILFRFLLTFSFLLLPPPPPIRAVRAQSQAIRAAGASRVVVPRADAPPVGRGSAGGMGRADAGVQAAGGCGRGMRRPRDSQLGDGIRESLVDFPYIYIYIYNIFSKFR